MSTPLEITFTNAGRDLVLFNVAITSDQTEVYLKSLACDRVGLLEFVIDLAGVVSGKDRSAQLLAGSAFTLNIEADFRGHFAVEIRAGTDVGQIVSAMQFETAAVDALLAIFRNALGSDEDTRAGALMVYRIDGARITNWEEFHAEMARAFGLGSYYGRNFAALRDSLPKGPARVVWSRADVPRAALGDGFNEVLELLSEVAPKLEIQLT
jgi:RNAse (barnase) inhibitor barstar